MKRFACIFPGQGSQAVGMASPFLTDILSSEVFFEVCDSLGFDLLKLISKGPEEELRLTANAQPAILATSTAAWKHLEKALGDATKPAFMAGHSLGEFSALVAAGSIGLKDAVRLVRRRGELMQDAVPAGIGAMAALIGGSVDDAEALVEVASAGEVLDVANINAPGQSVISGHAGAVDRAVAVAREHGFKRAVPLQVSAPFHSKLMGPVREKFAEELRDITFAAPTCPIVHNVTAEENSDPEEFPDFLAKQIDSPVRWVESVQYMIGNGVEVFVEVGHGNVLQGLVRKIAGRDWTGSIIGVSSPEDIDRMMEVL